MKFLPILGALVAVTFAVPTPERIRTLFPERTDLLEQISSFGRLLANDAHRVYRKSFRGLEVSDLDAMLGQLFDGQTRLWDQIDRYSENEDETQESEEDENPQDMFTELVSQLNLDPDSLSTLVSGEDRLAVDGKRMECMMELLDKISEKITDAIENLNEDSSMWRWVARRIQSAMQAMLRVIESIRMAIQDAQREVDIEEELAIEDGETLESEEVDLETQHGVVDLEDDSEEDDPTWVPGPEDFADAEEGYRDELDADTEEVVVDNLRSKRSTSLRGRGRHATVTSASRFQRGLRFGAHRRNHQQRRQRDNDFEISQNTQLGGGWSLDKNGLWWKNTKQRRHGGNF